MANRGVRRRVAVVLVVLAAVLTLDGVAGCQGARQAGWRAGAPSPSSGAPTADATGPVPSGVTTSGQSVRCAQPGAPCPVPGKVMVGAYLELSGLDLAQSLALRHQQLGRYPRILNLFYGWTDGLPDEMPVLPSDSILMLSWRGVSYASITNGSQDGLITSAARALVRYGKPVFLRWAWEMNGDWYEWGGPRNAGRAAGFIAAWRHVHDIFAAQHAVNVAWVWSPNYFSQPDDPSNDLRNYYPGDGYVDWVGVSGYSHGRQTPDDLFDPIYTDYAGRKPIMLAETGITETGGQVKPDWIRALAAWMVAHPAVAALVWFDSDHPNEPNWRIDTSDAAIAAYRQLLDDPHFSG